MTRTELLYKIESINRYEQMISEMTAHCNALKDEVKAVMLEAQTDEMIIGSYIVRLTDVVSNRFATSAFKKECPALYQMYVKQTTSRRFTIS